MFRALIRLTRGWFGEFQQRSEPKPGIHGPGPYEFKSMRIKTLAAVGTILTPKQTFRHLADGPPGRGSAPIVALGSAWAFLSLMLALQGHQPSGPVTAPFQAESYYFFQALFLPFLIYGIWCLLTWTTAFLARSIAGGTVSPAADSTASLANVLGYAYGVPLLLSLVLPDLLILWVLGFEGLSKVMLYYAPLTVVWMVVLCTLAVRSVYGLSWVRSLTAALGGLLVQALVGAIWIR